MRALRELLDAVYILKVNRTIAQQKFSVVYKIKSALTGV